MPGPEPQLIPLRIRLPYGTEEEFIEKYGPNVGRGGIFIATKALKPEGTGLSFELILSDGTRLMRGEGVVLKAQPEAGGARAGMTVRFSRLDARSKALVDRVLAHRAGVTQPLAPEAASVLEGTPRPPRRAEEGPLEAALRRAGETSTPLPAPGRAGDDVSRRAGPLTPRPVVAEEVPLPKRRPSVLDLPVAPPNPSEPPPILGIDLGTTNCRVAVFLGGRAQLIPLDSSGSGTALPSVIALDEKERFLFGARAKAQLLSDPKNTLFGAKRLIGRRARSRRIRELQKRFPYPIVPDPEGDAGVELRGKVYMLPELFAMLLTQVRNAAQELLGRPVTGAVLCVPAYFNDHQRSAMLQAGRLAGLEVVRILNEPSAVALAFGYGRGLARKRVLVYDLGGGTFDASVVQITGDDLEVVSTGGDNFLGGLDFDSRVAGKLTKHFEEREKSRVGDSLVAAQRIRDAAEVAKIALSEEEHTAIHVPFAATRDDGSGVDLRDELTRSGLEELTADLVERTVEVTHAVLEAGGLSAQSLDEVILVGGQSRAPIVRRRVQEALGKPVRSDVDPHAAVALGAAILGHAIEQAKQGKPGVSLSEVLSAPIGIGVKGGGMRRVLERNTRLPAVKTISLPVRAGVALAIAVFQGTGELAEENEYLGALSTQLEKAGEVTLRFAVSPDGTLQLSAAGPDGRQAEAMMATLDAGDEVRGALLAQAPLPGEPDAKGNGLIEGLKKLFGRRS